MTVYLDASTILPTLIEEAASAAVDRFIAENDEPLVISEFAAVEVASALSRLVRTGLLDRDDASARLAEASTGTAQGLQRVATALRAYDYKGPDGEGYPPGLVTR